MINDKRILSIVLARKGSKGIKNKNFRFLMGRPLVQWSILASYYSKCVDITVVSSNCDDVYKAFSDLRNEFSCIYGPKLTDEKLKWIQRPDELAQDLTTNEPVMIHAVQESIQRFDLDPDIIVMLQPTSPCRIEGLLDKCIEKYNEGGYDSLISGIKETPFIWQFINGEWKFTVDKNGCCNRKMRQDFLDHEFIFHDDGNIYITDKDILIKTKCRIGKKPVFFEVKGINSIQIDEEFDFNLIENMAKVLKLESLI